MIVAQNGISPRKWDKILLDFDIESKSQLEDQT